MSVTFTYVIESASEALYIGMSGDPVNRLTSHRAGHTKSTDVGDRATWDFLTLYRFENAEIAHRMERFLQTMPRAELRPYIEATRFTPELVLNHALAYKHPHEVPNV